MTFSHSTHSCKALIIMIVLSLMILPVLLAQQKPSDYFGFEPGSDGNLFTYEELIGYLQKLDDESDKLKMVEIGRSPEGRPMYIAFISSPDNIEKLDKLNAFCRKYKLNVVLKGAYSAVCNASGDIYFNPTGNPGLATAGSGDVLTGIIGALHAQGLAPFYALRLAVYLHGASGDEAARKLKTPWIQASDIIHFIPQAVSSLVS